MYGRGEGLNAIRIDRREQMCTCLYIFHNQEVHDASELNERLWEARLDNANHYSDHVVFVFYFASFDCTWNL